MEVTPTIVEIRKKADAICQAEIERTLSNIKDLPPKARKSLEKMATAITNKMLHDPIQHLKSEQQGDKGQKLALIRQIYGLDDDENNNQSG